MSEYNVDVLLVEDRAEDAEMAIMALKKNNLVNSIEWVKDGQEALYFLFPEGTDDGLRPKMVLLDLKMPKVGGIEVLRAIRTNDKTKTMPVVVLTTSKEEQDLVEAYALGVNSYILKPVGFENFLSSVKDIGFC